ncbi:malectin domain-containing carbohydrate-binding protein [Catellatospora methionotrophica]|uniref:malectin domain-containing carbohydrate-binding protein n=1 Tax=Catellatospora methionotrophica TaxID=121620 RepID=UPI0033F1D732
MQPSHDRTVSAVPSTATPNINDGTVNAIVKVDNKVFVGGTFTGVTDRGTGTVHSKPFLFAFDATTGLVDPTFAPNINDEVLSLQPGNQPGTIFVGGRFSGVLAGGWSKLVLLSTTDGAVVESFKAAAFNGAVNSIKQFGDRILVGGFFTTVAGNARNGLATVNATTGAFDPFVNISLTGHHNYPGTGTGASSAVGATELDITPDGTKAVVLGNFKQANGGDYDQVVMLDLTGAAAAIRSWHTNRFDDACSYGVFDKWVRDVDFAPDGSYFVVVSTGGFVAGSLCDAASRWETSATGTNLLPTWVAYTGGDTLLSVAVTGTAVYVGGHQRWMNNPDVRDAAGQGAVTRPGLAALEPGNGIPTSWNPGRNPRGVGASALYATEDGLYVGSDTDYIGNYEYMRGKIAFFPLAGGATPPAGVVGDLPTDVFFPNSTVSVPANDVLYRVNAGGPELPATDGGSVWAADTASTSVYRNAGSTANTIVSNTFTANASVPASTPLAVFDDRRFDPSAAPEMMWNFPVAAGTQVEVRLSFVARDWNYSAAGQRVFDIKIDGVLRADNYDTVAQVGYKVAHTLKFPVTSDGTINIEFIHGLLNPAVDAIEIVRTSAGSGAGVAKRSYNGTTAGALTAVGGVDGTVWANLRGAFLVDNTLYYGMSDSNFYKRSFDGVGFGPASLHNPHADPRWDGVLVDERPTTVMTYNGKKVAMYAELPNVRSMFYSNGRLYYTMTGQNALFWRYFSPDGGVIGAQRFQAAGSGVATALENLTAPSGALFLSGGYVYWSRTDGRLIRRAFDGTNFTGVATAVSGPAIDTVSWVSPGAFLRG